MKKRTEPMWVKKQVNRLFIYVLFFITGTAGSPLFSQSVIPCLEELPLERVVLITDRDYYLAGEVVWFQGYVFLDEQLSSELSQVLYVEIFRNENEVIVQQKYECREGLVNGALDLPGDMLTGHYFVRAYTRYGRNFPVEDFFSKTIAVVNPESAGSAVTELPTIEELGLEVARPESFAGVVPVGLQLSKEQFAIRESVSLKIEADTEVRLTVVIRKKGTGFSQEEMARHRSVNTWLTDPFAPGMKPVKDSGSSLFQNGLEWVPEIRGLTVSGQVVDKLTGDPLSGTECLTAVIGEDPRLHLARSGEYGKFVLPIRQLNGEKDLAVTVRYTGDQEPEIRVSRDFSIRFPAIRSLPFDTSRHQLFEEMYINQQLCRAFTPDVEEAAFESILSGESRANLGQPDFRLNVRDYVDLPSMVDIFREIVPFVSVRRSAGKFRLQLYDRETATDRMEPLIMLDRVPVSDLGSLLAIDPARILSIGVYYSVYRVGDHSFDGIVAIDTDTGDFAGYSWEDPTVFLRFVGFQAGRSFRYPVYSTREAVKSRKPDFRTVLYWNPVVELQGGQPRNLVFTTSDHLSGYEIVASGYTSNGKYCYGKIDFEVVK